MSDATIHTLVPRHQPELPYGGDTDPNSGFAGSDTSEARARRADASGQTADHQQQVLTLLTSVAADGVTWKDLEMEYGWHHGVASGILSNLHKVGRIARLSLTRHRCKIYVLPSQVNGRATEEQGQTYTTLMLGQAMALLERVAPCNLHNALPDGGCVRCEASILLRRFGTRT